MSSLTCPSRSSRDTPASRKRVAKVCRRSCTLSQVYAFPATVLQTHFLPGPLPGRVLGNPAACRENNRSEQTFYRWRRRFGGRGAEAKKLRGLERENPRLTAQEKP